MFGRGLGVEFKEGITLEDARIFEQKSEKYIEGDSILFEQSKLFSLCFSEDTVSFEYIRKFSDAFEVPILFAYDEVLMDKNGEPCGGFIVTFLNDVPIKDTRAANAMKAALRIMFPDALQFNSPKRSGVYFDDCLVRYFDKSIPEINIEALFRNMTVCLMAAYGDTHYKSKIKTFAEEHGLRLTPKNLIDVSVSYGLYDKLNEKNDIDNLMVKNGKISPESFIILKIRNGENLPIVSSMSNVTTYQINFVDKTEDDGNIDLNSASTSLISNMDSSQNSSSNNPHSKAYRSSDIALIRPVCQLFNEFEDGSRILDRLELTLLATTLIDIESGLKHFLEIIKKYSKTESGCGKYPFVYWRNSIIYMNQMKYKPMRCDLCCSHSSKCRHAEDILSTAKPKRKTITRSANSSEQFYSFDEAVADFKQAFTKALNADDTKIHAINAPLGLGKSTMVLDFLEKHPDKRCLVALSTNDLKNELYDKAKYKFQVVKSPSLAELKDKLPANVRQRIERLHQLGKPQVVSNYIKDVIEKKKVSKRCSDILENHLKDLQRFYASKCHAFTTHARLLTFDYWMLKEYDAIIIDEDIILNCIIPNQTEILISDFKKILKKIDAGSDLAKKIKMVMNATETESLFTVYGIRYDKAYDDIPIPVDIPSFCMAEKFYFKRKSDENNLIESNRSEDSIVFFKPLRLNDRIKYIMLSATLDPKICNYFFSAKRVSFYDCKKVKYTGTLYQCAENTMSRADMEKKPGIVDKIAKLTGNKNRITFKKYSKAGELYFGKTTGIDSLKGKDLDVIGTPHQPEFLYKLLAYTVGHDIDVDAKMVHQPVFWYEDFFSFQFMTFGGDNRVLRNIQFWMIKSELEQAVGRARLIHHDCTVNVFSNFPVHQAKPKEFHGL